MTNRSNKNNGLLALSAAALALPGISTNAHAAAPTESTLSMRYTKYVEDDLHADQVANEQPERVQQGSTDRYEIDVVQLGIAGPIGARYGYSINVQDEVLSGASPWTTELAANGTVDVVMSGASIDEHRTDFNGTFSYYYDGGSVTGALGMSTEDDYDSTSFGLSTEREFHNKQTTLGLGFSYSDDTINPEDSAELHNRVPGNTIEPGEKATKDALSMYVSVARVVSPSTQVLAGFSYTQKQGYLHDAYKRDDNRPDKRNQYTYNFSIRQFVKKADLALHFDYRYYDDTWGVQSHTATGSIYKNWEKLQIIPFARYYVQSNALFYFPYQPKYPDGSSVEFNYFSNDARLSDYGAFSGGLRVVLEQKPIDWVFVFESYYSDQEVAPNRSDNLANPGLVQYMRFSIGLDYRF